MADHVQGVEIHLKAGEDFNARLEWVADDGEPIAVKEWARMDVRDAGGNLILRFDTGAYTSGSLTKKGYLRIIVGSGAVDMFVPWEVSRMIVPGSYYFDLFVGVNNPGVDNPSFQRTDETQKKLLTTGRFVVHPAVTKIP